MSKEQATRKALVALVKATRQVQRKAAIADAESSAFDNKTTGVPLWWLSGDVRSAADLSAAMARHLLETFEEKFFKGAVVNAE